MFFCFGWFIKSTFIIQLLDNVNAFEFHEYLYFSFYQLFVLYCLEWNCFDC